ncbi:MAG: sulfurtransferase TusA family protein [Betaproteobacteria bacterium]|nr:sulfurtransferase TusA family protein [Betaproteobacteria bacterium]
MSTKKSSDKPLVTLDLCGLNCPAPLLGAKHVIDDLRPGQVMQLISDCPGTPDDLFAWSRHTGNEVIATDRLGGRRVAYTIRRGETGAKRPVANVTLDMRGVSCPGPIIEAKKLLDGMKPGEILLLVSNCPGSPDDVNSWVRATGLELLAKQEVAPGTYEFFVRNT